MLKKAVVPIIVLLVLPVFALAQVPDYTDKYVNDFGQVFNESQAAELRALFSGIDSNTTAEMTILTVDTVSPNDISQYAQDVFDKWKIGKADKDNGLLILYAKDTQKIWVQTGYGLEGILPDAKVGSILDETFVPARDANNSAGGMVLAAHAYADVINENAEEVRSGQAGGQQQFSWVSAFILLWFIISLVRAGISRLYANPKCKCGGRADIVKTEVFSEKKKLPLGLSRNSDYTLITYQCARCGEIFTKKVMGRHDRSGFLLVPFAFGGGRGGLGGGGGFGGGRSGGGGAGR